MVDENFFMWTFFYPIFGTFACILMVVVLFNSFKHMDLFCGQFKDLKEYAKYKAVTINDEYQTMYINESMLKEI